MKRKWKNILASILTMAIMIGMIPFSASAEMQTGLLDLSRQAATEGVTMLQNNNDVLPLENNETVSIFGRVQIDYFACGYGSGGDVKYPYITNPLSGLRRHPDINVNEDLASVYEAWCRKNPPNHGSWGNWPYNHAEMPLDNEVVADAAGQSDVAVVIIGRSAGEDRECTLTKGSYYLTDLELDMLDKVTAHFDKVVVLMNVGNVMDMEWFSNYKDKVDALLYTWMGGMESGKVIADVLSGDVTPSGKLSATIAKTYADYPSSDNFGKREYNNYAEDIFVGYRYFETFAPEDVLYPFGFGLSYTDFTIQTNSVTAADGEIKVSVTVKNTGDYPGKEVVQVYYGAPQGTLGKAKKSLAAYAKTGILQPGESQNMTISFKVNSMASYDDAGKTGKKSAYVLEAGDYPIYVGNSVSSAVVGDESHKYTVNELTVVEQLTEVSAVQTANAFDRMVASEDTSGNIVKNTEPVPTRTVVLKDKILENMPDDILQTGDLGYKLMDVYNGTVSIDKFVAQLTVEELEALCRGDRIMGSSLGAPGNASVFGGISESLRKKGVVPITTSDGPSGIRLTASATLLPIGMTLACTWNNDLVEKLYAGIGAEMLLNGSDALLAPGMNIQRDPLCGRNFEYFSEDPLLTGQMGSAVTRGVQSQGVSATPKHYAANNQEVNRNYNDSRVSERALREIYLKGFEICVKTAKPQNIMTSYNKINGVWGHYNYDLCTTILRDEWGFGGVVMTDWWMRASVDPDFPDVWDNAYRVRSQVDVLMPGDDFPDSLLQSYARENGITLGEMQRSAINVLNFTLISAAFRQENDLPYYEYTPGEPMFTVEKDEPADPRLTAIKVDGEMVNGFNPLTLDYVIFTNEQTVFPEVTAEGPENVNIEIIQPTTSAPAATIKVTNTEPYGSVNIYRVLFTNEAFIPPTVPNPIYAYVDNIYVNGSPIQTFYREIYDYDIVVQNPENLVITADVPADTTYSVTYRSNYAIVRAETIHHAAEYKLYYSRAPQSDEFDGTTLKDFWTVGNQNDNFSMEDGYIKIISERGDFYGNGSEDLHNYVMQPGAGSWDSVTRVEFDKDPFESYHQIGVMIMQDSANYINFRYEYNNWSGTNAHPLAIKLNQESNNSSTERATVTGFVDEMLANRGDSIKELYFKVNKHGNSYNFYVSYDGENFTKIGDTISVSYSDPKFVLTALNGNTNDNDNPRSTNEPLEVKFDYARFNMQDDQEASVVSIKGDEASRIKLGSDYFYMTSGLGTENCNDEDGGVNVGWTSAGQFLLYNINVEKSGYYNLTPRIASNAGALTQMSFNIEVDGTLAASFIRGGGTGGWQSWVSLEPQKVYLEEGRHKLKFYCNTGDFNMNWLQFDPIKEPVDSNKMVLEATIAYAQAQDTSKLNALVKEKYDEALANAISVYGDAYATQEEVDTAVINLLKMIHMLSFTSDPAELEELVALADTFYAELDRYKDGAVKEEFIAALQHAKDVLDDPYSLDADYEEAWNRLNDALDALKLELKPPVDTSQLEKVINRGNQIQADKEKYLDIGWDVFEQALAEAKDVLANSDDQDEIDAAVLALHNAILRLRLKPNKDLLKDLLEQADTIDASLYTAASVRMLADSSEEGRKVFNDPEASQVQVNNAAKGIEDALKKLVPTDTGIAGAGTESANTDKDTDASGNGSNSTNTAKTTAVPRTGEEAPLFILILLLAGAAVTIFRRRKNTK